MADRPAESPEETYVRQLVSAGRRDIYRGELSQLHSDGFIDEVEFQRRSSLLNRVAEPTIKDAVDTLRAWLPTLHKSDESEYDYGYRSAYERIADWLEHEFPATWAASLAPQQGAPPA